MTFEDKPQIGLGLDNSAYRHCAGETHDGDDRQADRELVADHLGARTERTDEGELIVTRPSCEEDTEDTDARHGDKEEDADIEVDDLQTVAPRKDGESKHRCENHQIGGKSEEESVDMVEVNDFFNEHLEHIGEALEKAHGTDTVGAKAALECGAEFTLVVYVEEREQGIDKQKAYTDQKTFDRSGEPARHEGAQEAVYPLGDY